MELTLEQQEFYDEVIEKLENNVTCQNGGSIYIYKNFIIMAVVAILYVGSIKPDLDYIVEIINYIIEHGFDDSVEYIHNLKISEDQKKQLIDALKERFEK